MYSTTLGSTLVPHKQKNVPEQFNNTSTAKQHQGQQHFKFDYKSATLLAETLKDQKDLKDQSY